MDKLGPTIAIVVIVILVFLAMWWGWRRRGRRDGGLRPVTTVPAERGAELAGAEVFYVATTKHDVPIERLAIRGLGFRGRATATVSTVGVVLAITGENPVFIGADRIETVDQATWAIDRVVEPEGLVRIAWRVDSAETPVLVDSYLRVIDPDERKPLVDALRTISAHPIESEV